LRSSPSRCGGGVGRVADRDGISALDLELAEDGFEDTRRRFRFLDVVRRSGNVDQVGDARNFEVFGEFILLDALTLRFQLEASLVGMVW
jgi:hypothetical protein